MKANESPKNFNLSESDNINILKLRKIKNITLDIIFCALIIIMLMGAFVFATNSSSDKSIFGYRIYAVLSGSMTPIYPKGSIVIVKLTEPSNIEVGDDITFYNPDSSHEIWTHRVTQVVTDYGNNGRCFKTQGVANSYEDSFITLGGNVVGVVEFSIPYAGYILEYIQNNILISIVIILLVFMFIKLIITLIRPTPIKPRYGIFDEEE